MADTVDLCKELRDALAAATFPLPIEVNRIYVPTFTMADLANHVQVTVAPAALTRSIASRSQRQIDTAVDVTIHKQVSPLDVPQVDALVDLTDALADFIDSKDFVGTPPTLHWIGTEVQTYDLETLHSKNIYTALLTPLYRTIRIA